MKNSSSYNPPVQQIRYSTDDDLQEILSWLKEQDENDIKDTFYCNRNIVIGEHNKGKLIAYISHKTSLPIAYQLGGLLTPGILEVRKDHRGQGIGKKLVEYRIQEARENDKVLLMIQCAPSSSIPFWEHMGFQLYGGIENKAFMLLDKENDLPTNGSSCMVEICFFNEERKWKKEAKPIKTFNPLAVKTKENYVYLSERVSYFDTTNKFDNDPVISINIDGELLYLDKAKYDGAKKIGVKNDGLAFYLDKIAI